MTIIQKEQIVMTKLTREFKRKIELFSSTPSYNCIIKETNSYMALSLTTDTGIMWCVIREGDSKILKKSKFEMLENYINMSLYRTS